MSNQADTEAARLRRALLWTWTAVAVLGFPPWVTLTAGPAWFTAATYAAGWAVAAVALWQTARARRPR